MCISPFRAALQCMPSGKMALKGRLMRLVFVQVFVALWLCSMQGTCAQGNSSWQTLSGKAPLVIARGGLSGLFPDQTLAAYQIAISTSLSDAVMFCDLQLTKDAQGICRTDINLENTTNIESFFPNKSTYLVNGQNITGYFAIDHTGDVLLNNITATQPVLSRPVIFDGFYQLLPPDALAAINASSIWLNVQYSKFYDEHNLSMPSYVRSLSRNIKLNYISSTEVGFLRAIAANFRRSNTKLIFRFLSKDDTDPSINQTYGSILTNLTFVKTFAAGILVPKSFIWPLGTDLYLQAPTTLVEDAHTSGLEIFAADFASDEYGLSYNYSYDPVREYLQFVDIKNFSVDGILTDFPVTASEAIACYAHNNVSKPLRAAGNPLIISHNGASGDYVGSTDIAYEAAIRDGADYIDCSVQITKDGVPFCRESPDLMVGTTVSSDSTYFPSKLKSIPDIQSDQGIFTFDLKWGDIQGLQKNIFSPFNNYQLVRNPAEANKGNYMNLTAFLQFAKGANISVLVNIENARAIISSSNLDITNATLSAISKSGYDNETDRIMIQSDDSAVLLQFKQRSKFKLIYKVDETNVAISDSSIKEIKTLADTVTIPRGVIYPSSNSFLLNATDVVTRMHRQNISVFVHFLRNEFPALAFDYFADPTMEINSFVEVANVDGLITDFPATASAYLKNACRQTRREIDYNMQLVSPGALLQGVGVQPPAQAPAPSLGDVIEPPLPSLDVSPASEPSTEHQSPTSPTKSGCASLTRHSLFVSLPIGLFILFFASY